MTLGRLDGVYLYLPDIGPSNVVRHHSNLGVQGVQGVQICVGGFCTLFSMASDPL